MHPEFPPSLSEIIPAPLRAELNARGVLVAEDHPLNQKLICAQLRKMRVDLTLVANGAEALEAVRTRIFGVILMDCQMPVMDGFGATRAIREWEQGGVNPEAARHPAYIIAVTAGALAGDREACLAAGMNDYLPKPAQAQDLARVFAAWGERTLEAALAR
ncbi:MAG TPA: response regulator [Opitutaceae bacterium]|nr:response regulator [Opitutaceae bacterium]